MKKNKSAITESNGFSTEAHGYRKADVNNYIVKRDAQIAEKEREYKLEAEKKDMRIRELEQECAELRARLAKQESAGENK